MITLLISRGYVHGAEAALLGWMICAAVYFAACMIVKANRSQMGQQRVGVWFLVTEVLVDLIWCLVYYGPEGYINFGIGGVYLMVLWPAALLVAGFVATAKNQEAMSG